MLTLREKENRAFVANGLTTERYQKLVDEEITALFPSGEESAILRKAIAKIYNILAEKYPETHADEEFINYNKKAEEVKKNVKNEIAEGVESEN